MRQALTLLLACLAAVLPQSDPVRASYAASVGVIVAGVSQAALCWWGARRLGAHIRPSRLKLTPEIRILVRPEDIDDLASSRLARDVVKKIEEQLQYPGQIKVTVIRETRAVDYAR